ncbi:MAG: cation transporter [Anaerolineales bacterium]
MNEPQLMGGPMHVRAVRLEWATVLWNVVEAVVAIGSGAVVGSAALVAFGADSLIEVSSAVVVLWRLIRAGPDVPLEEQLELDRRAHLLVGITFFLLAAYISVDAGLALLRRAEPESSSVGILLAIASLIAMPTLATLKQRTGRAMGSRALEADAVETWLCAYLSGTLLIGLGLNAWLGWWWADAAAALAMVPFIVWQGWDAFSEARSDDD